MTSCLVKETPQTAIPNNIDVGFTDPPTNDSVLLTETCPIPDTEIQIQPQFSPTQGESSNDTVIYDPPEQTIDSPTDNSNSRSPYQLRDLVPRYGAERFKAWTFFSQK